MPRNSRNGRPPRPGTPGGGPEFSATGIDLGARWDARGAMMQKFAASGPRTTRETPRQQNASALDDVLRTTSFTALKQQGVIKSKSAYRKAVKRERGLAKLDNMGNKRSKGFGAKSRGSRRSTAGEQEQMVFAAEMHGGQTLHIPAKSASAATKAARKLGSLKIIRRAA